MSRRIKFRAWDKAYNAMILPEDSFTWWISFMGAVKQYDTWATNDVTLLQFTGLTDRNGVEIYEGDVVNTGELITDVYYSERWGSFELRGTGDAVGFHTSSLEVIGNIYQNPELLKGGNPA